MSMLCMYMYTVIAGASEGQYILHDGRVEVVGRGSLKHSAMAGPARLLHEICAIDAYITGLSCLLYT